MATKKKSLSRIDIPVWEWVIAAIGLAMVSAVVGLTLYRALTESPAPPRLEISVESTIPSDNGYHVTFRVRNTGSQTAAALVIEGSLMKGEEAVETSTATLTYAPANSDRHGGLIFTKNPGEYQLKLRAVGYEKP